MEIERRKRYLEEHGTKSYFNNTEKNPFASKIICGECNKVFTRKGRQSSTGEIRKIWQCSERYKMKGIMGCANRHVVERTLEKAFIMAWNGILENKEYFRRKWEKQLQSKDTLEVYRAKDFLGLVKQTVALLNMESDFMLRVLQCIKVFESGELLIGFFNVHFHIVKGLSVW